VAVYKHQKMEDLNQRGHKVWETAGARTTRSSRNSGKFFVRKVTGLRTRVRLGANFTTAERIFSPNMPFGAAKGTIYAGGTIGRTNMSVGNKDGIRLWY